MAGRDSTVTGVGPAGGQDPRSKEAAYRGQERSGGQTNGLGTRQGPGGLTNGDHGGQPGYGGRGGAQRASRRDEVGPQRGQQPLEPGQELGGRGRSAPQPSTRGSPASGRQRGPGGRGGGGGPGQRSHYNLSPSAGYLGPEAGHPDHEFADGGQQPPDRRGMDRGMERGQGPHARSRSASRGFPSGGGGGRAGGGGGGPGYHSLDRDRDGYGGDRDFMPIDRPRDRSLDRPGPLDTRAGPGGYGDMGPPYSGSFGRRDRSLDRGRGLDPMSDLDDGAGYRDRGDPHRTRLSPNPVSLQRDAYMQELQSTNSDLQRDLANLKKELELTNQKLGSSMHSIKTFWSPELKKERALRKEESAKYALMNDQLKLLNSENQVTTPNTICHLSAHCVHDID